MMRFKWLLPIILVAFAGFTISSCTDDDSFSASSSARLSFSADSIRMDTVFSNIPTAMKSLWVYNRSGDGLRCTSIRLERGNQSGFRVNVDGTYLGQQSGFQTQNVELCKGDSIRVFVELTSPENGRLQPVRLEDNLLFTLENGNVQRVHLDAYSWDAQLLRNVRIEKDTLIGASPNPIVIMGGLTVAPGATLRLAAGACLYFHSDAQLDVYGRLLCEGSPEANVVLRGDRTDRLFDYLPYDYVSGQWQGIRLHGSSFGNKISYTDIHGTMDGISIDSTEASRPKLELVSSTVHNCQGYGLKAVNANVLLENSQITNTLKDCVYLNGGVATVNNCTFAQFYPFDGNRGAAFSFASTSGKLTLSCTNTLITGYADDVLTGVKGEGSNAAEYLFADCIIRTPQVSEDESAHFKRVIFENPKDTAHTGTKHFAKIDTEKLRYDFRLSPGSAAVDKADAATAATSDRDGNARNDGKPDVGAYELKH